MNEQPTLLFLHGVGGGDASAHWEATLSSSLVALGYPSIDEANVLAPKYPNTLLGSDDNEPLPKITIPNLSGNAAKVHRREFERRTGRLEALLGRHERGVGWFGGDAVNYVALKMERFVQAKNYLNDRNVRAQVLTRILRVVPTSGRLVIVGHSLGSVIAADLIRRLPVEVEVTGLVTLGSPLAHPEFQVDGLAKTLREPPSNLGTWVNFWNDFDPVTTHRGVSESFRWMLDHRTRFVRSIHGADDYLKLPAVGAAIGYGLFGSLSKALVPVQTGVDIPLEYAETVSVMALRYAHTIARELKGDQQDRYVGALRSVQASTYAKIKQRNTEKRRPMAHAVEAIAFDFADVKVDPPIPEPVAHLSKDDSIIPLISIALSNVIQPYEVDVPSRTRRASIEALTVDMGLGSQIGSNVFKAIEQAKDTVSVGGGPNWFKLVALGLGAAALIGATGGLALVAAPGLAGAAAITSALAAFGPGGMLGGLLTAGTLAGVGGGGIAIGLASPATTTATFEAVVTTQLSVAILREFEGIEQDPTTWNELVATGIEVGREIRRLEAFSDESAPTLSDLRRKRAAVDRALTYLQKHQLRPFDVEGQDSVDQ